MNPVTHGLIGWMAANAGGPTRRDRALIAFAGVAPDADGFGFFTQAIRESNDWFTRFHHVLGHNIGFGMVLTAAGFAFASKGRRWRTAAWVLVSFHLHLFGDFVGGRGPDDSWPIPYLLPFANPEGWRFAWEHQ